MSFGSMQYSKYFTNALILPNPVTPAQAPITPHRMEIRFCGFIGRFWFISSRRARKIIRIQIYLNLISGNIRAFLSLFQAGRKRGWGYVVIKSKDRISPDFRRATRVAFGCGCPAEQLAIMEISKMTITYFYFFDVLSRYFQIRTQFGGENVGSRQACWASQR